MMNLLYGNSDFNDLLQEGYLTTPLLSNMKSIIKPNTHHNIDILNAIKK